MDQKGATDLYNQQQSNWGWGAPGTILEYLVRGQPHGASQDGSCQGSSTLAQCCVQRFPEDERQLGRRLSTSVEPMHTSWYAWRFVGVLQKEKMG